MYRKVRKKKNRDSVKKIKNLRVSKKLYLVYKEKNTCRALIPVGEGVVGSSQLTVGDVATFQPALTPADPTAGQLNSGGVSVY